MYKYRIARKKENKYQIEDLLSKKMKVVSEKELKGLVSNGSVTNAVVRDGSLVLVQDALEAYIKLRDKIWEVSSLIALVGGKAVKGGTAYTLRFFDGYGEDITPFVYDFVCMELNLKQDGKGNILYVARTLNPLGEFKMAINKKVYKVQKNLVPEKAELVESIIEYNITKSMQEVIKSWDC